MKFFISKEVLFLFLAIESKTEKLHYNTHPDHPLSVRVKNCMICDSREKNFESVMGIIPNWEPTWEKVTRQVSNICLQFSKCWKERKTDD